MAQTILVAIDLLEGSIIPKMIDDVRFMAKKPETTIHFITVMPNLRSLEAYGLNCDTPSVVEKNHQALIQLTDKLKTCVKQFELPETQYQCHAVIGTPNYNIIELADKIEADVIVIGSSSRNKRNILLGSTADYVVSNTSCSVLVIRH